MQSAADRRRFWWVNQNQTFEQEVGGGYLWSPKQNANGARSRFYENMREVGPGDIVYSFCDTRISAIGVAVSYAYECPKPAEFGAAGPNWGRIGWKADVRFNRLVQRVRPKDHIDILRPLLPARYSPLQSDGNGLQQVYLAEISQAFAEVLAGLVGHEGRTMLDMTALAGAEDLEHLDRRGLDEWEDHIENEIASDDKIPDTERKALVKARRGQGTYRRNLLRVETLCRITKVDNRVHLVGSHIKPWRDCENDERLDGENGLLLTPSIDHLFDRGFISFDANGDLLVSPRADHVSLRRMGLPSDDRLNVGEFTSVQKKYLEFHRDQVLLRAS